MLIGELSKQSSFSRDTIRFYEKLGLIQATTFDRKENNYKNYSTDTLERLGQIRQFKELSFTLTEIEGLLDAFGNEPKPCAGLPTKLDEKIDLLNERINLLEEYRTKLFSLRKTCDGKCGSNQGIPDCFD